jgi:hypothetical protein
MAGRKPFGSFSNVGLEAHRRKGCRQQERRGCDDPDIELSRNRDEAVGPDQRTTPGANHGIGGRAAAVPESFRLESRADSGPSTITIGAGNMTRDSLAI